ncbi:response regulator [Amphibacillus xylanus]|uniref:Response regulatory domain-containing protein n=1 Tax=Amphibacillus xylanus (strain ATCC 51415 / DSM 6626 / JCM 7361 / LMG 17667 / NBRC 15112 / Ep01) TaxID=698758 RepID=K0J207_AMPXN|nr:response regulator [Amphibacillus xylanus]BAM46506.1 hypothetical protein AXY_03740 [Amphibacillus xylanus NBRC 15112]
MFADEKINLLIVDKLNKTQFIIESVINQEKYNLVRASTSEEAIQYIVNHNFALILLDDQTIGVDSYTTVKVIRAIDKTKDIPILFINTDTSQTKYMMNYFDGSMDYILKPVDPLILKHKIDHFIKRRL